MDFKVIGIIGLLFDEIGNPAAVVALPDIDRVKSEPPSTATQLDGDMIHRSRRTYTARLWSRPDVPI